MCDSHINNWNLIGNYENHRETSMTMIGFTVDLFIEIICNFTCRRNQILSTHMNTDFNWKSDGKHDKKFISLFLQTMLNSFISSTAMCLCCFCKAAYSTAWEKMESTLYSSVSKYFRAELISLILIKWNMLEIWHNAH